MADPRRLVRRFGPVLLALVVLGAAATIVGRQGLDARTWLAETWRLIAAIPLPFVVAACLLKTIEVLLNTLTWRTVLQAAYPERPIPFRQVLGVVQGTIGIFAVVPPKFGGFAVLGLYRLAFPDLAIAGLIATRMVQGIAVTVFGIAIVLVVLAGAGGTGQASVLAPWSAWIADKPMVVPLALLGIGLLALLGLVYRNHLRGFGSELTRAGAIFRTPGRYAWLVALPSLLAIACRWAITGTLLAAFGIPANVQTIFLVNVSHGLARYVQVAPGGFGTTQAFDLVALQSIAPAAVVTAYSLAQAALLLAFNVAFGLAAMTWAFGWEQTKAFLRRRGQTADVPEATPVGAEGEPPNREPSQNGAQYPSPHRRPRLAAVDE